MVHVREVDGNPVRFGHSGWLWHNTFLLYDHATESLWHPVTGRAMSGPMRGRRLRTLPVSFLTWRAWRTEHPGTLVLRKPQADVDDYAGRNARMTFGYAVDVGAASRIWQFSDLPAAGAVEDEVGGTPVVVVRDMAAEAAFVYERPAEGGRTVSFDWDARGPGGRPVLRERGGSRAWFARTGLPVPGTDAREPLRQLPGSDWEAAAWALQHPWGTRYAPRSSQEGR